MKLKTIVENSYFLTDASRQALPTIQQALANGTPAERQKAIELLNRIYALSGL
jgi:hypothetical protein